MVNSEEKGVRSKEVRSEGRGETGKEKGVRGE